MSERCSPYQMEQEAIALLAKLIPEREAETDRRRRKELSRHIKLARTMRDWARTRAGYVKGEPTTKPTPLLGD